MFLNALSLKANFEEIQSDNADNVKSPNILFISIDDLKPELGVYGNKIVRTPNLDQLANQGSIFMRHYVQVPTCGASRHSLLTGLRPTARRFLSNQAIFQ